MTAMVPHVVIFGAKFSEPPKSARPILYTTIGRLRSSSPHGMIGRWMFDAGERWNEEFLNAI